MVDQHKPHLDLALFSDSLQLRLMHFCDPLTQFDQLVYGVRVIHLGYRRNPVF
jgi:hypothetical protein